jgi:hypothetical protein
VTAVKALFELNLSGSANTSTKDDWYDLGSLSLGGGYSPIPSTTQLWLGLFTAFSQDKGLTYELRVNNSGQSTGTTANTHLLGVMASDPSSGSMPCDLYYGGAIQTLAPTAASTGTEKLWLRVQSGTNTVANFSWFLYFTNQ